MKKINKKIIKIFVFAIFSLLLFLALYINNMFRNITFEQLLYSLFNSGGTSFDVIIKGAQFVLGFTFLFALVLISIKYLLNKINKIIKVELKIECKKIKILTDIFKLSNKKELILLMAFCIFSIVYSVKVFGISEYIKQQNSSSNLFENYYVDPSKIDIKFSKNKKNLIYIYVESLEMTGASKKNGGDQEVSYIPRLEDLATNSSNINFSNTEQLGGALQLYGTSWTAAAMISQTSGVPLKVLIDGNEYKNFGESLPGIFSLGEILSDNGYKNYLMLGSKAEFGGRRDYFTYHGEYTIYDYNWAVDQKLIDSDYYVWWGYEDKKLFDNAKNLLLEIANNDEPFNFTLLTADTHFTDGYLDESCSESFNSQYANVFYCADSMIYDFISWIQRQDFYDDTTIIITGDHLTMQNNFYSDDFQRVVYNTFINSSISPINSKNRLFSTFDMFPTTLAALGAKIDGDRLGLGVNLFSGENTLIEELGFNYLNEELSKKSFFYDNYLLRDTYYKMLEDIEK